MQLLAALKLARWHVWLIYIISNLHIWALRCTERINVVREGKKKICRELQMICFPADPCFISYHSLIETIDNLTMKQLDTQRNNWTAALNFTVVMRSWGPKRPPSVSTFSVKHQSSLQSRSGAEPLNTTLHSDTEHQGGVTAAPLPLADFRTVLRKCQHQNPPKVLKKSLDWSLGAKGVWRALQPWGAPPTVWPEDLQEILQPAEEGCGVQRELLADHRHTHNNALLDWDWRPRTTSFIAFLRVYILRELYFLLLFFFYFLTIYCSSPRWMSHAFSGWWWKESWIQTPPGPEADAQSKLSVSRRLWFR